MQDHSDNAATPPPPPVKSLICWLWYIPYSLIFIVILLTFEVLQRISLLFGKSAHEHVRDWLNMSVYYSLLLLGTRVSVNGENSTPKDVPLIIIANHQSMFDIPILHHIFRNHAPRFIAKKELARGIPAVSVNLRNDGSALINRKNRRQAIPEIEKLADRMREQKLSVVIFPEGTRARNGALKRFRTGGLETLIANCPEAVVVPVAIDGSWKLTYYRFGLVPTGTEIKVEIGKAISVEAEDSEETIQHIKDWVRKIINEWRAEI